MHTAMHKTFFCVLVALALGTGFFGGWKLWRAIEQRREVAAFADQTAALQRKAAAFASQRKAYADRITAIEADTKWLQASLARPSSAAPKVSAEEAEQRIEAALAQTRSTVIDSEAALRELLWGLDEGMLSLENSRKRSRLQLLVNAIAQLGERHPPALAALRERQAAARAKYLEVGNMGEILSQYALITRALRDQGAMIALLDSLPVADETRRREVSIQAYSELVAARRYKDAVVGRSLDLAERRFDLAPKGNARFQAVMMAAAAKDLEVLAGSESNERAASLIAKMLLLDGSEENRALVRHHLERAGRLDLMP